MVKIAVRLCAAALWVPIVTGTTMIVLQIIGPSPENFIRGFWYASGMVVGSLAPLPFLFSAEGKDDD